MSDKVAGCLIGIAAVVMFLTQYLSVQERNEYRYKCEVLHDGKFLQAEDEFMCVKKDSAIEITR